MENSKRHQVNSLKKKDKSIDSFICKRKEWINKIKNVINVKDQEHLW